MNNMQLYLIIGIPTLTVILAWVSNRSDSNRLNDKVDRLSESLIGKVDRLSESLNGKVDRQGDMQNGKIDALGASLRAELIAIRNDHHKDNMTLLGYMVPLHERMAKLESRSEN